MACNLQITPKPFIHMVEQNLSEQDQEIVWAADSSIGVNIGQLADNSAVDRPTIDDRIDELVEQGYLLYDARTYTRPEYHALKVLRVTDK